MAYVRVVVGGQRDSYLQQPATAEEEGKEEGEAGKQISSITPTCIGRDMVILSRDADFEGVPNFFRKFLLDYTEQYTNAPGGAWYDHSDCRERELRARGAAPGERRQLR